MAEKDRCENADRDCVHPPTSLVYIAGILREKGFEVLIADANAFNATFQDIEAYVKEVFKPDWIIFRSTPSTFYHDCKVVEIAKKHKIRTLMLNWNLHYVKERVMEECSDLDVYLNAYHYEYAIPEILDKFPYYPRVNYPKTFDIAEPAWDLIENFRKYYTRTKWFSPWAVVRGSKGCPYSCGFCVDAVTGWYPRSPVLIGEELEYLTKKRNVPYISFFDNTFEIDADWCLQIASQIERRSLKFKWYVNSRTDLICKHGVRFFKRLRETGLDGSSIGIEFGTNAMLEASNKGTTVEQGKEAISILHKAGIKTYLSCMIGYLGETKEQMQKTVDFIKETKPTGFQINTIAPFNGTVLFDEALEKGLIDEAKLDWRGLSCVPTDVMSVQLSELSMKELIEFRKKAYRSIYFSGWMFSNLKWALKEPKLALGYLLSSLGRLRHGVEFSH